MMDINRSQPPVRTQSLLTGATYDNSTLRTSEDSGVSFTQSDPNVIHKATGIVGACYRETPVYQQFASTTSKYIEEPSEFDQNAAQLAGDQHVVSTVVTRYDVIPTSIVTNSKFITAPSVGDEVVVKSEFQNHDIKTENQQVNSNISAQVDFYQTEFLQPNQGLKLLAENVVNESQSSENRQVDSRPMVSLIDNRQIELQTECEQVEVQTQEVEAITENVQKEVIVDSSNLTVKIQYNDPIEKSLGNDGTEIKTGLGSIEPLEDDYNLAAQQEVARRKALHPEGLYPNETSYFATKPTTPMFPSMLMAKDRLLKEKKRKLPGDAYWGSTDHRKGYNVAQFEPLNRYTAKNSSLRRVDEAPEPAAEVTITSRSTKKPKTQHKVTATSNKRLKIKIKASSPKSSSTKVSVSSSDDDDDDDDDSKPQFACDICPRVFSRHDKLTNHVRSHYQMKKHRCDECEKSFTRADKLRIHQRVHTGERPFVCQLCDKAFMRADKLARHHLVHSGEKPYECEVCDKRFSRSDKLTHHRLIHVKDVFNIPKNPNKHKHRKGEHATKKH